MRSKNASKQKVLYGGTLFGPEEKKAVNRVLEKNWWGPALETENFEKKIAKVIGVKYAVFVNSGSSAFDLGLRTLDLPKGSEIIVPACTFPTPIASIIREGYIPVVVDVKLGSNFIDPDEVKKAITKKTKAILVVYVCGAVGNLKKVLKIAKTNNLMILEDNSDGLGGKYNDKYLGSYGIFSVTSTHPAHIISTGGGGVLFTNKLEVYRKALSMRDWGRAIKGSKTLLPKENGRYLYTNLGSNFQALELQAAIGTVQLKKLQSFIKIREKNFQILLKGLKRYEDKIILPEASPEADVAWFSFPFVLRKPNLRSKLTKFLDSKNIEWRPILAGNISKQPAFKKFCSSGSVKNADLVLENGLWVSVHPQWDTETMEYLVTQISAFLQKF